MLDIAITGKNCPYIRNITNAILKNISINIIYTLKHKFFKQLEPNKISVSHCNISSNVSRSFEVHMSSVWCYLSQKINLLQPTGYVMHQST